MYWTEGQHNLLTISCSKCSILCKYFPIKSDSATYPFPIMGLHLKILREKKNNKYCFVAVVVPFFFKSFLLIGSLIMVDFCCIHCTGEIFFFNVPADRPSVGSSSVHRMACLNQTLAQDSQEWCCGDESRRSQAKCSHLRGRKKKKRNLSVPYIF